MPADAALTSSQKAQIQEKVKTAAQGYLDSLGIDEPVIHNRLLSTVMGVEGVFDVALEIFDLSLAEQPRRINIQPAPATRPQLSEDHLIVIV